MPEQSFFDIGIEDIGIVTEYILAQALKHNIDPASIADAIVRKTLSENRAGRSWRIDYGMDVDLAVLAQAA